MFSVPKEEDFMSEEQKELNELSVNLQHGSLQIRLITNSITQTCAVIEMLGNEGSIEKCFEKAIILDFIDLADAIDFTCENYMRYRDHATDGIDNRYDMVRNSFSADFYGEKVRDLFLEVMDLWEDYNNNFLERKEIGKKIVTFCHERFFMEELEFDVVGKKIVIC